VTTVDPSRIIARWQNTYATVVMWS